ncbi:g6802 [Coccomyxa viridis]|uniref:G6802 protein n=1 Tax=Coccomyxa viridis TaxID=1274662 RepID=A0ABP1FWA8_9CHLO
MPAWTKPLGVDFKERQPSTPSKYSDVKALVRTGFNELRARAQNQDARPQARFQHGEPFKRIKGRQLAELLSANGTAFACLVLDIRDVEEHTRCRIKGALSYPARLLSRAVNPLSNKVLEFVNAEDSIIVICDWDGTLAAPACALLSEKGVQNAVLLHGGLRAFADRHAELLEGDSATLCSPRQSTSVAGSTVSRGTSCSAAVRRAREHMRSGQSIDDTWPSATSLLIAPPRLSRGSLSASLEPLHLGLKPQPASATAGPWK